MEIFGFGRFHVPESEIDAMSAALREIAGVSREEEGCVTVNIFQSTLDRGLFYLHSCWRDKEAFKAHGKYPHTMKFLELARALADQPIDTTSTTKLE